MARNSYTIKSDGLSSIEYNILVEQFGKKQADELVKNPYNADEKLDEDLEEIISDAPALIED